MDLAEESTAAESLFSQQHVLSSSCSSPSNGTNGNGNALCLFYPSNPIRHNVIQSSRASNTWIASLRAKASTSKQSPSVALDPRQHHHELSAINTAGRMMGTTAVYGRSCTTPSSSFNTWSAFYRSGSLESIEKNRRLRQLAAQSTTKVRSLTERESTAAAERWRYIQSVLDRRRRESEEHRERFIRQPLEKIIRQSQSIGGRKSVHWESIVRKSILKRRPEVRWAQHWLTNVERHVRFNMQQTCRADSPDSLDDNESTAEPKLPVLSPPDNVGSESCVFREPDEIQRLPPLQAVTTGQPSWVERQVAKVKQRKLWAQQRHPTRILKRTVSLLVNVSDDCDTDSLDGDGRADKKGNQRSVAWDFILGKEECNKGKTQQEPQPTMTEPYGGWAHFPHSLAKGIEKRQQVLNEKKVKRKEKKKEEMSQSSSLARRKIFTKSLLMAVIRMRRRKDAKRSVRNSEESSSHSDPPQVADSTVDPTPPPPMPYIAEEMDVLPKSTLVDDILVTERPSSSEPECFKPPESLGESTSQSPTDDCKQSLVERNEMSHSDGQEVFFISLVVSASCNEKLDGSIVFSMDEADAIRQEAEKVTPCRDDMIPSSDMTAEDGNDAAPLSPVSIDRPDLEEEEESISEASPDEESGAMSNVIPTETDGKLSVADRRHSAGRCRIDSLPCLFGDDTGEIPAEAVSSHLSGNLVDSDPIPLAYGESATVSSHTWAQSEQDATADSLPIAPVSPVFPQDARQDQDLVSSSPVCRGSSRPAIMAAAAPISNHDIPLVYSGHSEDQTSEKEEDDAPAHPLDKKTKESRNASRLCAVTTWTQTEPAFDQDETDKVDVKESRTSSAGSSNSDTASETLANLEQIRRQLKKARLRRQDGQKQKDSKLRVPLQARVSPLMDLT